MKKILRKIAFAIWILYILFGIICCFASTPGLGILLSLPAVLGIILTWGNKPEKVPTKPRNTTEKTDTSRPATPAPQPSVKWEEVADHVPGVVKVSSVRGKGKLTASDFIVFDLETTGLSEETDQIIEVAALKVCGGKIVDRYESLVNPHQRIPADITKLTGISDKDVRNAPSIDTVLKELCKVWTEDLPIVAHNAPFDVKFISTAFSKAGINREIKYIDTLWMARDAFPDMEDHKLSTLISELGLLDHAQEHRAMSDVEAAYHLYLRCREILSETKPTYHERPEYVRPSEVCRTVDCVDPSHPLCGKNLVFTGNLSIGRKEAMQMAVNVGAVIKSAVSSKTDYLIVGDQDKALVGEDGLSGKEEKAYALNEAGKAHIRIIREAEFLQLISGTAAPVK